MLSDFVAALERTASVAGRSLCAALSGASTMTRTAPRRTAAAPRGEAEAAEGVDRPPISPACNTASRSLRTGCSPRR